MLLLRLDIHRNILSMRGFIHFISDSVSKIQISLKNDSLCFESYKDSSLNRYLKILMPDNFLEPFTVSSIICKQSRVQQRCMLIEDNGVKISFPLCLPDQGIPSSEIHETEVTFRVQLQNMNIDDYILENGTEVHFKDFMQKKFEPYESFYIYCTTCGSLLTDKSINIKSVQKYHEEMTDCAETWFCHKQGDNKAAENRTDLLYISDMHLYFHDSVLKSFLDFEEGDKCYKCRKCLSYLSLKKKMNKPHYIGFFADKIMLEKSETETDSIQNYKRDIALLSFNSVVQDLLRSADFCKIYLQSKVDEQTEVLLLQFHSSKGLQFLLNEVNEDDIPSEIKFKLKEVYEVLYYVTSPDSSLSKKWKHDFNVDFFLISDNMMTVIKDLLQESSGSLQNEGLSIGYLPAHVSIA